MNANPTYQVGQLVKTKLDGQIVDAKFIEMYHDSLVLEANGKRFLRTITSVEKTNGALPIRVALNAAEQQVPIGAVNVPLVTSAPEPTYFDVNTRFSFIERMVDMVVRGHEASFIVTGSGGVGKSFTIFNRLKLNELGEAEYKKVSGHMTPKSLYRTLFEANNKIVVFDDCDSVLANETAINILKAALDSYSTRTVHWSTESDRGDLPNNFEFTGRIIFITNYSLKDVPQPLVSRAMYVDVTMTPDEKMERIRAIATALVPDMDAEHINECIELIDELKHRIQDLNFRTVKKVCSIRKANPNHWRPMSTYMVTAR